MAFTLVVKNSSTSGKLPTIANIQKGELALNLADQKLYSRSTTDEIFEIGRAGETPSGGTDDRPGAPSVGDLYFDTDLNALLYWNGSEWVPVGTEAIAIGDLTDVDTSGVTNGMVLVYDNGEWKPVSPASLAVDVDLGYTADGDNAGTVTNTAGDDATIPVATDTVAGLFTGAEKQKLAGIETGAQVNAQAGRALSYDTGSDPDTLNADIATDAALGVVKIGDGISIDADGEITADIPPGTVISETPPADPEDGQLWWADSDVSEGGGRLYVWTGDEWVDTSLPGVGSDFGQAEAEGLFLSKKVDDTAEGEITFKGLTTHEAGVSVTGGDESYDGLNFQSGVITLYSKDNTVDLKSSNEAVRLYQETSGTYFGILSDGRSYLGPNSSANVSFYISNPARNDGVLLNNTLSDTQTGYVGFNAGVDRGNNTSMNYLRFFQAGAGNNYTTGNPGNVSGYYAHRNIALRGDNAYGFYSEVDSATGDATNKYNFYAAGNAPSRIPNLQNTFTSFLDISELDQTDDEGNPINWEQPTAATVGTGIYRNAAGALCFARNGECALEIGDGQVIGNLLDKLESIEARLAALEGA